MHKCYCLFLRFLCMSDTALPEQRFMRIFYELKYVEQLFPTFLHSRPILQTSDTPAIPRYQAFHSYTFRTHTFSNLYKITYLNVIQNSPTTWHRSTFFTWTLTETYQTGLQCFPQGFAIPASSPWPPWGTRPTGWKTLPHMVCCLLLVMCSFMILVLWDLEADI